MIAVALKRRSRRRDRPLRIQHTGRLTGSDQ
jgi:hypothetical protein